MISVEKDIATIVITSCNREKFLRQTLNSIMECDLKGIKRIIVIEDSDALGVDAAVDECIGDFHIASYKTTKILVKWPRLMLLIRM